MKTMTASEFRANLADAMAMVTDDHAPRLVTRAGGRPAVLLSAEDWAGMEEAPCLLRNPRNAARVLESIAGLKAGKGVVRDIIE